ncbi:hypothetical protein WJX73_003149 [Symbiochloris irregularis]|uniref:protein-tyrosine-phosphatase n=1 Tax=Symbiochloris irregularis TaxID=706552 RepID=A0AAW1NX35_9CHLO
MYASTCPPCSGPAAALEGHQQSLVRDRRAAQLVRRRFGPQRRHTLAARASEQSTQAISAEEVSTTGRTLDVSNAVVEARFRSTPWAAENEEDNNDRTYARILFISESNACRSVLAQAIMERLLQQHNLADSVKCESKATRDYSVGAAPEPVVAEVAAELGIQLPQNFASRQCDHVHDVVQYDLILVMDKYTASDFLKEVSVYETINKQGNYTLKVHRLGEFHPQLRLSRAHEGQDIGDPLYGNVGGQAEKEAVMAAAATIQEACSGLLIFLQKLLPADPNQSSIKGALQNAVMQLDQMEWLAPPMLTPKRSMGQEGT